MAEIQNGLDLILGRRTSLNLINSPKCPIPLSKPPTSNFGLNALNKREAKMDDKGITSGVTISGSKSIAIKSDSESGNSDTDDKIEVLNVKNGVNAENG